jgi:hypothetical protein
MWKIRRRRSALVEPTSPNPSPINPEAADRGPASAETLQRLLDVCRKHQLSPAVQAGITQATSKGIPQANAEFMITWVESQPKVGETVLPAIGEAWLEEDGAITMRLRTTSDGQHVSGTMRYQTTDEHYEDVLNHLGGLKPGEKKLIPPWED